MSTRTHTRQGIFPPSFSPVQSERRVQLDQLLSSSWALCAIGRGCAPYLELDLTLDVTDWSELEEARDGEWRLTGCVHYVHRAHSKPEIHYTTDSHGKKPGWDDTTLEIHSGALKQSTAVVGANC